MADATCSADNLGFNWPTLWGNSGVLKIISDREFVSNGKPYLAGRISDPINQNFCYQSAITVVGNVATFAPIVLPQTDALDVQVVNGSGTPLYTAIIYSNGGATKRQNLFSGWHLSSSLGLTFNFAAWTTDNNAPTVINPRSQWVDIDTLNRALAAVAYAPATTSQLGLVKISATPADTAQPIAYGTNDTHQVPTSSRVYYAAQYDSFDDAVLMMGSSVQATLIVSEPLTATNPTIPPTVTLEFVGNGKITLTTGMTVTIQGAVVAASRNQIFANALSGQGTVVLTGRVYPDWWTKNVVQGTTNMATAITAASKSVCSGALAPDGVTVAAQGFVAFNSGWYRADSSTTYHGAPWAGEGKLNTLIDYRGSGYAIDALGTNAARRNLCLSGFTLTGLNAAAGAKGIRLGNNERSYRAWDDVSVEHFPSYGLFFEEFSSDMEFFGGGVIANARTSGAGVGHTFGVQVIQVDWFGTNWENSGQVGSSTGGAVEGTDLISWTFHGGLVQSNKGRAEMRFTNCLNINFLGTHLESGVVTGVSQAVNGLEFDGQTTYSLVGVKVTAEASHGGAAIYSSAAVGSAVNPYIDQVNWPTVISLASNARLSVFGNGNLSPSTAMVSTPAGTSLIWSGDQNLLTTSPATFITMDLSTGPFRIGSAIDMSAGGIIKWGNGADYGTLTWDTGKAEMLAQSGKYLSLGANGLPDQVVIAQTGRLGVATTTPTGLFDVNDDHIRVRTAKTPASAAAAGNQGDIAWDANFIYICVAANQWKRSAIATW